MGRETLNANEKLSIAPFPLKNPVLITIPLAFIVGIAISMWKPERQAEEKFAEVENRINLGF